MTNNTKKQRCIAFIINKQLLFALATVIVNLKEKNIKYDDIVVYHSDLDSEDIKRIQLLEDRVVFIYYSLEDFIKDFEINTTAGVNRNIEFFIKRFSHLTYCKFKVCELLKDYRKVLFLDVDILIIDNIEELFEMDGIAWRSGLNFHRKFEKGGGRCVEYELTKDIPKDFPSPNGGLFYISDIISEIDSIDNGKKFLYKFMPLFRGGVDELCLAYIAYKSGNLIQLDYKRYNVFPQVYTSESKIIHFMGPSLKPWNNQLISHTFPEWFMYYVKASKLTGIISSKVIPPKHGSYLKLKINEEQWFQFFYETKFRVKDELYINHIYKNEQFIMNFNESIYYELKFKQYILKKFCCGLWIKDNILINSNTYIDNIKRAIERCKNIIEIDFHTEKQAIYLQTNYVLIDNVVKTFDDFYSITRPLLNSDYATSTPISDMSILENKICGSESCFGCGACYNICPSAAISMIENAEGFREPVINEETCVHCDACKKVCPALNPSFTHSTTPKVHAFVADPEALYASSSGGAFTLLAEKYLVSGGYVVGAVFDEGFSVHHIIISDTADLDLLRRSKYVQSNQGLCYRETKKLLDANKQVLYSGTPCQIAGLKGFLGKEYDNLVTIDLLCHGVPPQKHLHEYIEKVYGIKNIATIEMRGREWQSHFRVAMKNGQIFNRILSKDNYLRAFLADLNLRSTCYECKFATLPRQGDITLGDLWTAKKMVLGSPYEKKSSIVLLNSEKGEALWQEVLQATTRKVTFMDLTEKFPIEQFNPNITKPNAKKRNRAAFIRNYPQMGFEQATIRTLYPYDVGLVLYMSDNYGSTATNFALYKALQNLGHKPIILDNLTRPEGVSNNFVQKYLARGSKFFDNDDYRSINFLCDSFVVGSDQSWRWDFPITKKYCEYLFMSFARSDKRKIAYAPSFGIKRESMDGELQKFYTRMLGRFDAISVREDFGVDMCKHLFGVEAKQVADPVFLVERDDYIELSKQSELKFDEKFLFAYILDPSPEKCQLINESAERLGVKSIVIYNAGKYGELRDAFQMEGVFDKKPEFIDWLSCFVNAEYIITDSFHGACFSLILQKQAVVIKNRTKARFDNLSNMIDDTKQHENSGFYENVASVLGRDDIFKERNFGVIEKKLAKIREESLFWLKSALESTPRIQEKEEDNDLLVEYARLFRNSYSNPIIESVKPYLTARVDVKIENNIKGDFEIVSVSDNRAEVMKPAWLQKEGTGYQIQSNNLSLDVTLRTKTDGDISIRLKGLNVQDKEKKRIPHWIEYQKFAFNKTVIFNEKKYAWHDEPLVFTFPVTEGEVCTFSLVWRPRAYL